MSNGPDYRRRRTIYYDMVRAKQKKNTSPELEQLDPQDPFIEPVTGRGKHEAETNGTEQKRSD